MEYKKYSVEISMKSFDVCFLISFVVLVVSNWLDLVYKLYVKCLCK